MEITMSTNDVNNFSVSELNYIRDAVENMNKFNQIEVLRILNNHKDVTINENKYGIHINLSEIDKEIMEKQDLIEKLLEDLMDDELKKLLDELEKLMKENNKEEIKDKMDEITQSAEDMKKQLDRSLEMLKKAQLNEKIDGVEKELKKLAEEQENLKKAIDNQKTTKEAGIEKQKELNKKSYY